MRRAQLWVPSLPLSLADTRKPSRAECHQVGVKPVLKSLCSRNKRVPVTMRGAWAATFTAQALDDAGDCTK